MSNYSFHNLREIYKKNFSRYFQSFLITFGAVFGINFLNGLLTFKEPSDITSQALVGIVLGAIYAAFRSVIKLAVELLQKRI